ncbi:TPA: hypothetical protein ACH3X1_016768 [Trebouxia sp. C0004]
MLLIVHADHDSGHTVEIAVQQDGMTDSVGQGACCISTLILLLVNSRPKLDPATLTSIWESGTLFKILMLWYSLTCRGVSDDLLLKHRLAHPLQLSLAKAVCGCTCNACAA